MILRDRILYFRRQSEDALYGRISGEENGRFIYWALMLQKPTAFVMCSGSISPFLKDGCIGTK